MTDANPLSNHLAELELKGLATSNLVHQRWVDLKDHLHSYHYLETTKTQTLESPEGDLEMEFQVRVEVT